MAFLITPIDIDGTLYCCGVDRTTDMIYYGGASNSGSFNEVYNAQATGTPATNPQALSEEVAEGGVKFGVCCATGIELTVWSQIETLNSGYDWLSVQLNGVELEYFESSDTTEDPWDTTTSNTKTFTIPLPERPCGNIITITGSTDDEIANNDVWWRFNVTDVMP